MIIAIYGLSILKSREFRKDLLSSFSKDDIYDLATDIVIKDKNSSDVRVVIERISNTPWRQNNLNNRLLKMLGILPEHIFDKVKDEEIVTENISSFDKFYELLDYQYVIRQRALNILNSQPSQKRFLIHMPTGTGKTKTATHIISQYYNYSLKKDGLVIWIAHTKELLQQAYDTFKSVWKNIGNGNINVYKLWGNNNPDFEEAKSSGFVVCGIQKLQSIMSNNPELFEYLRRNVRLIVYDEAHKATAKETKTVVDNLMDRKGGLVDRSLMGLTATPGRTSDYSADNNILVSMFGNKIIEIDTKLMNMINLSQQEAANAKIETDVISYFQKRGVLAKIEKEELTYQDSFTEAELNNLKVEMSDNGYYDFTKKALETIGSNKNRNLEIKNFGRNVKATGLYFLFGVLLSALFQRYVPQEIMVDLFGGNKAWGILMAATVGVPLYACGGGTIPLLQQWLWERMSLGSATAFMITGPATKITNLGAVKIVLGIKRFLLYIAFVMVFSFVSGILVNIIV